MRKLFENKILKKNNLYFVLLKYDLKIHENLK